ncbi:MAG TPA: DUF4097 family beta strand repeat-containing protein [Pseudoxanthomonas sp.]
MRKLSLLTLLLLAPAAAFATAPECKHSQPRNLTLDLTGVKTVVFDIASNDLTVDAIAGAKAVLGGKGCASDEKYLQQLKLTQHKAGDKLYVTARREGSAGGIFLGSNYAYLKLAATLPDNVMVQLKVGSGDAVVTGAPLLSADVGSGDVEARHIRGLVAASVNSGDIILEDIGSLHVISVGSGDLSAKKVRGPAKVGSVGSGDFELNGALGDVEIGSVGSGDARVTGVSGSVNVASVGSGDLEVDDIRGDLSVRSKSSGSVSHNRVDGRVDVPSDN